MNISENLSNQFVTQSVQRKDDMYFYSQSWIWRAIEALASAKDFNPSPTHLSNRLNITVEEVVCALEGLERLGLILRVNNGFKPKNIETVLNNSSTEIQSLIQSHVNLSSQILTQIDEDSFFINRFLLGNKDIVKSNLSKIKDFFNSIDTSGEKLPSPEVFAIQISITQVTNKPQGELS